MFNIGAISGVNLYFIIFRRGVYKINQNCFQFCSFLCRYILSGAFIGILYQNVERQNVEGQNVEGQNVEETKSRRDKTSKDKMSKANKNK